MPTDLRVLLAKELQELWRSRKMLVGVCVFLAFGAVSPLLAHYARQLVAMAASSGNMSIHVDAPTAQDALSQYLKNISQIGVLLMIIISMGAVAGEKERGTFIFLLAKPVSRRNIFAAKIAAYWLASLLGLTCAAAACYAYTGVLFQWLPVVPYALFNLHLYLYLATMVTLTIALSARFRSPALAGVAALFLWIAQSAIAVFEGLGAYLPAGLLQAGYGLTEHMRADLRPVVGTIILTAAFACLGGHWLNRWELTQS